MNVASNFPAEEWLRTHASDIGTAVLGGTAPSAPPTIQTIAERRERVVAKLSFDGTQAIAKIFDDRKEGAKNACEREIYALATLGETGLVPRLYSFSNEHSFAVMEFIPGQTLEVNLSPSNVLERAHQIGAWSARYIASQPRRDLDIDWFAYFSLYQGLVTDAVSQEARKRFEPQKVKRFALARNDQSPTNYIVRADGQLIGIDFERTRFKPVGWDVITAAWVLQKRIKGRTEDIVSALIAGWNSVGVDETPENFEDLALFFARQAAPLNWSRAPDA